MRSVFPRLRLNWVSALGILCIGLVLVIGMAQVAHFHAGGAIDHDCALCVAAHHIAHAAPQVTLHCTTVPVAALIARTVLVQPRKAVFFRLISRPPPSGSARLA
jgi:hypothetical protein